METRESYFEKTIGEGLSDTYRKYHPQVLSNFEEDMERWWGRRWKANTTVGRLRMVLLHRPGKEFLSVGKPTPWEPHHSSLAAWRMPFKPDLDLMIQHHDNLVKAYQNEGVEVVIRDPDPNDPSYQIKSIYCDDVCHPSVYGQVIFRMYDHLRRGEEVPTFRTLAKNGCPVVGMITGNGMIEGGPVGWLDEKHLAISVHYPRENTCQQGVMRANESGHLQFARIVKEQDPEVDIRIFPGYGTRFGASHYAMVARHTSVQDPKYLDPYLVDWMRAEMDWQFIVPPEELTWSDPRGWRIGPDTGVVLEPWKIIRPAGDPKGTKWLESISVKVVEVDCATLVGPMNTGSIHCLTGSLIRDPEV